MRTVKDSLRHILPLIIVLLLCGQMPVHAGNSDWKKNRDAGEKAMERNDPDTAGPLLEAALAEAEQFGPHDYRLAESLEDLGILKGRMGKNAEAETLLRRAAEIRRGDPDCLLEADCCINLGIVCQNQGKYDEAEKAFQRGQDVVELKLRAYHPAAIVCMFHRAVLYDVQGKDEQAEPLLKLCLPHFETEEDRPKHARQGFAMHFDRAVQRITYQPNYAYALQCLGRLTQISQRQNRPTEAEAYAKRALKVLDQWPDKDSPEFETALENLARIFLVQRNYADTETVLLHAAKLEEKSADPKFHNLLRTLNLMAKTQEQNHQLREAAVSRQQIVARCEQVFGPDSDETADALMSQAKSCLASLQYEEAEPIYRRLLARVEKYQGEGVALTPILSDQAVLYIGLGKDKELENVYKHQIALYEMMFGKDSKTALKPLENYAQLLRKQKRDAEAEQLELRIDAIRSGVTIK